MLQKVTLKDVMLEDVPRIRRALKDNKNTGDQKYTDIITRSKLRLQQRIVDQPVAVFPRTLPISQHVEKLTDLIKTHQVIVVCGETGSGKSTQIPKICLQAGFGQRGMICQTQPRRIAARSVAERIAAEYQTQLGDVVGFKVRFSEEINQKNYIRVLTDGMLLAELTSDRHLNRYSCLIIDEAHERSLNIDFLLGLLKDILRKRPEFRVIITSATLDSEKFSDHFDGAPAIAVSGRTWPVEVRYCPMDEREHTKEGNEQSMVASIAENVQALHREALGDVLVFLPGEREIQSAAEGLRKWLKEGVEVMALYARLTPKEQHRIFRPGNKTRVILCTNVAETSLTVPGIKYVIDSGLARVSRYSPSKKMQRLPIEKISQASAQQRAGRCGRISNGICVRLYDEEDFLARPQYTDPEILRTSLADVILRMKSQRLGDVETFPFIDRPHRNQINAGVHQLIELGAIDHQGIITDIGKRLSKMPVDPRIARMLLAAATMDCAEEMVIIAAALTVPDPRLQPPDKIQHARQLHREMSQETSDFLVMLDIWRQFRQIQKQHSKRESYRWCENNFLSVFRMREWGALQANLKSVLKQLKVKFNQQPADPEIILKALLPGLLSNVAQLDAASLPKAGSGLKQGNGKKKKKSVSYQGTFGKTLSIFPASVVKQNSPKWIVSAELVETSQVYARMVSAIQPHWLESAAQHILQFQYSDPAWDKKQERVVARRRATMYGLSVYSGRKCDYAQVDAEDCRRIFIQSALVNGELESRLDFLVTNRKLAYDIEMMQHKTRRQDILVDDAVVFDFYYRRIADWVNSASTLRKWYRQLDAEEKQNLIIPKQMLMVQGLQDAAGRYPDEIQANQIPVPLHYQFAPGNDEDGVTAKIRLPLLNQMNAAVFERLVPGLLKEKLVALMRTLPKTLRRHFVPLPDTADQVIEEVKRSPLPLSEALCHSLGKLKPVDLHPTHFKLDALPPHLNMRFDLVDDKEKVVDTERDLHLLQQKYADQAHASFVSLGQTELRRDHITKWDFDELPISFPVEIGGFETKAFPALVDHQTSVSIALYDDEMEARYEHQEGVRRLLWLHLPEHRKLCKKPLPDWQKISLMYAAVGDLQKLQLSMFSKAQDQVFFSENKETRTRDAFNHLIQHHASQLPGALVQIAEHVKLTLSAYRVVIIQLNDHQSKLSNTAYVDINNQLENMVYDGFVDDTPVEQLRFLPRFIKAIKHRIEHAILDPETDYLRYQKIHRWWHCYLDSEHEYDALVERFRWMIEEYRVSIFAQSLKTSEPVSAKRLEQIWSQIIAANRV